MALQKDAEFYRRVDSFVDIQVENTLFSPHVDKLREASAHFREILPEKAEHQERVTLEDVKAADFAMLLRCLYFEFRFRAIDIAPAGHPKWHLRLRQSVRVLKDAWSFTPDAWISVLHLARKFGVPKAETTASNALHSPCVIISPVERLLIARRYQIDDGPTQDELVSRREPLTVEESTILGVEITLEICNAREERLKQGESARSESEDAGFYPKKTRKAVNPGSSKMVRVSNMQRPKHSVTSTFRAPRRRLVSDTEEEDFLVGSKARPKRRRVNLDLDE